MKDIDEWTTINKLKLNKSKTELIVIGSQHRPKAETEVLALGPEDVNSSNAARNIFEKQMAAICKTSFFHIRQIVRIRRFLSDESVTILVHAFVTCLTCRLDNCYSLLYGLPKNLIQNCAARLIMKGRRSDHITPIL